jgi:DNA polymerase III epsilon subunit-like protein
MKTQVMLDIETLGKKPGSVIVAIGAVKFGNGQVWDTFYERVDPESCVALGLRMDVSTVMWWMLQNDAARQEITQPGWTLSEVLMRFSRWIGDREAEVWGNGASFDNVLVCDAYDRARLPRPWKYFNDRCYRTVKNLHPEIEIKRGGTHHNALDDAKSQALHLMAILERRAA